MTDIHDALSAYPTQVAAAAAWGISPQLVSEMARGRKRISARAAVRIEAATGVPAIDLLLPQLEQDIEDARKQVARVNGSA
jgi:DNA-binding transcriptional regulator YdaS (Cro superfamily)